jgi:hypothetical protein
MCPFMAEAITKIQVLYCLNSRLELKIHPRIRFDDNIKILKVFKCSVNTIGKLKFHEFY